MNPRLKAFLSWPKPREPVRRGWEPGWVKAWLYCGTGATLGMLVGAAIDWGLARAGVRPGDLDVAVTLLTALGLPVAGTAVATFWVYRHADSISRNAGIDRHARVRLVSQGAGLGFTAWCWAWLVGLVGWVSAGTLTYPLPSPPLSLIGAVLLAVAVPGVLTLDMRPLRKAGLIATAVLLAAGVAVATAVRSDLIVGATWMKHPDEVRFLLAMGANPNARDTGRLVQTPLHYAAADGDVAMMQLLLDRGADPDARGWAGFTPLHEAVLQGHLEAARLLLQHGADPNASTQDGTGLLHAAAMKGHAQIARLLLEYGANANARNGRGDTPLWSASYRGKLEVVRVLIESGADVNSANNYGETPLRAVDPRAHPDTAEYLRAHGAKE